jgi:hypothetical protein
MKVMNTNLTINQNPSDDINKSFTTALTTLFNGHIKIKYPDVTTFDIEQGLFTSGQYGSYRVPCYNKNKNMLCYIICDVIMGHYKIFDGDYKTED